MSEKTDKEEENDDDDEVERVSDQSYRNRSSLFGKLKKPKGTLMMKEKSMRRRKLKRRLTGTYYGLHKL